ncbi:MAG: hypothetical protein IJ240_03980, partial [Clostridia bacterium]|nr:hypothetical protein [Clostridia bacterium]
LIFLKDYREAVDFLLAACYNPMCPIRLVVAQKRHAPHCILHHFVARRALFRVSSALEPFSLPHRRAIARESSVIYSSICC